MQASPSALYGISQSVPWIISFTIAVPQTLALLPPAGAYDEQFSRDELNQAYLQSALA